MLLVTWTGCNLEKLVILSSLVTLRNTVQFILFHDLGSDQSNSAFLAIEHIHLDGAQLNLKEIEDSVTLLKSLLVYLIGWLFCCLVRMNLPLSVKTYYVVLFLYCLPKSIEY